MYPIDDIQEMLSRIADEIPDEFFNYLNGGVVLLEECKVHPKSKGDLYILGEYSFRQDMGRQIYIYYGSFMKLYANAPESVLYQELRRTLLHEFTHHLESLAGERSLEVKDKMRLNEYLHKHLIE